MHFPMWRYLGRYVGVWREQKRTPNLLELELQVAMCYLCGSWELYQILYKICKDSQQSLTSTLVRSNISGLMNI